MHEPKTNSPRAGASAQGAMTTVMRAVPARAEARRLRVALVHGGRVIEERIMPERAPVTVGASEKNTFVVADAGPSRRLFEWVNGRCRLVASHGVRGRVATGGEVTDVASVEGGLVPLDDVARGKVSLGEATFLFQLVKAPPPQAKPQIPLAVRASLAADVDWRTAVIAGFSFLLHFGAAGALYADWIDPVVDEEFVVAQIVDQLKQLPAPPPVDSAAPVADGAKPDSTAKATDPKPQAGGASKGGGAAKPGRGGGAGRGRLTDASAAALDNNLHALDVEMIAALRAGGNDAGVVLRESNVPQGLLNDAGRSQNGVAIRGGVAGLDMGGGRGRVVHPGEAGAAGLGNIGDTRGGAPTGAGSARAVAPPPGNVAVGGPIPSGGNVANAAAVVAGMAPGFRRCFNRGLAGEDPTMRGSVRVTARIGVNGEVVSATPSGGGGLSGTVVSCVVARVKSAQFAAPEGGGATIVIPIIFESAAR